MRWIVAPILGLLFSIGCDTAVPERSSDLTTNQQTPSPRITVSQPGTYAQQLRLDDGSDATFTLLIPPGYQVDKPVPLILALHFGGPRHPYYGRNILQLLVEPALGELGAIIVAPDALTGDWATEKNTAKVLAILDVIGQSYQIDSSRTLVTGFSLGGHGTWHFASHYPQRFKAAIAIAGRPTADAMDVKWTVPMKVIHSDADEVVPLAPTSEMVDKLTAAGAPIEFETIFGVQHFATVQFVPVLRKQVPWIKKAWAEN